jgi:hypothetical protein
LFELVNMTGVMHGWVVSIVLLTLPLSAVAVFKDEQSDAMAVCASPDGGSCAEPTTTLPLAKDQVLMQLGRTKSNVVASAAHKVASEAGYALSTEANRSSEVVVLFSAAQLRDLRTANHIRSFSRDASNVARVIQRGITGLINSISHFTATPPRVADGIVNLGTELMECVLLVMPEDEKGTEEFQRFRNAWNDAFDRIPGAAESIQHDIEVFIRDGETPILIRAIGSIIAEAGNIVTGFLPGNTGAEVKKYLNAIAEAFETMGVSWQKFAEGRTAEGIEAVYWGLRSITDSVMPDAIKDNEVYDTVIAALDLVLGNLSKHILEYERHILESNVCWRTEQGRDRQRPSECPDKYVWDGQTECYPAVVASSLLGLNETTRETRVVKKDDFYEKFGRGSCRGYDSNHNPTTWFNRVSDFKGSLEQCQALCSADENCKAIEYLADWHCELWSQEPQATAEWSENVCYKKNGGSGAVAGRPVPARCEMDYPEKHGHFCYASCPGGFQVKENSQQRCLSACVGNYSAESPGMCGRDQGVLMTAIMEMVTVILNSAFSLADNIIQMQERGVNAELLTDTIQIFIDMGKPFANPICPEWELPTPAPTPAPTPENHAVCMQDCTFGAAPGDCRLETGGMVICLAQVAGACSPGQTNCAQGSSQPASTSCKMHETVYISGHSWNQLQDGNGHIGLSPNSQEWEQWTITDAGDDKVFLTSYHNKNLQDSNGYVGASPNKQGWEKWEITPAGNGKVFITSHRGEQLSDKQGAVGMANRKGNSESWTITDANGAPACS